MTHNLIAAAAIVAVALLAAAVFLRRAAADVPETEHDSDDCRHCAAFFHPSQQGTRGAVAAMLPRQTRDGRDGLQ